LPKIFAEILSLNYLVAFVAEMSYPQSSVPLSQMRRRQDSMAEATPKDIMKAPQMGGHSWKEATATMLPRDF
jgi:hypothetical protein